MYICDKARWRLRGGVASADWARLVTQGLRSIDLQARQLRSRARYLSNTPKGRSIYGCVSKPRKTIQQTIGGEARRNHASAHHILQLEHNSLNVKCVHP